MLIFALIVCYATASLPLCSAGDKDNAVTENCVCPFVTTEADCDWTENMSCPYPGFIDGVEQQYILSPGWTYTKATCSQECDKYKGEHYCCQYDSNSSGCSIVRDSVKKATNVGNWGKGMFVASPSLETYEHKTQQPCVEQKTSKDECQFRELSREGGPQYCDMVHGCVDTCKELGRTRCKKDEDCCGDLLCKEEWKLSPFGKKLTAKCVLPKCEDCSCSRWNGENYSSCRAVTPSLPCTGYCVKCETGTTTAMNGFWTTHRSQCADIVSYKSAETKLGELLLDLLGERAETN